MSRSSRKKKKKPERPAASSLFSVEGRLKRKLRRHLKSLGFTRSSDGSLHAPDTTKDGIRGLHSAQRTERLSQANNFITSKVEELREYFANGTDIVPSKISPRLELVQAGTFQSELFRLASLTWAVPVSEGYGRRMRFLVWDDANGKLIGIFALGDPVFNLRMRDQLIGWDSNMRRERLVNILDAFVLGAVPPYNMLLCGKLIACLIKSVEVKDAFANKYKLSTGVISGKAKKPNLVLVTTSSSLGRSSIYNRLKLNGEPFFESIGYSQGWGHFHIPDELFAEMRTYLQRKRHSYAGNNRFGQGPNWKMRAMRQAIQFLGENPDLLCHRINRELFVSELAENAFQILRGEAKRPSYRNLKSVDTISELAKERWIVPRAARMSDYRSWKNDSIDLLLKCNQIPPVLHLDAMRVARSRKRA